MLDDVMKISGYVMRLPRILLHPRDRPFQEAVRELCGCLLVTLGHHMTGRHGNLRKLYEGTTSDWLD